MAKHVTLKDANNQNIYPRTFAQNVYMRDGKTTIEDKINNIGGSGNIPEGDFVTTDAMTTAINNAVSTKYTKPSTGIPASDLADDYVTESELTSKNYAAQSSVDTKYTKPSTGIPKTDLASDIQTSLGKADTALQSIPAEYVTETELTNKNYDTVTSVNSKDTSTLNSAKAYTDEKIASLINGAPETLDTLDELAEALNDNADIVDTLNNAIGNKADKSSLNNYLPLTAGSDKKITGDIYMDNSMGSAIYLSKAKVSAASEGSLILKSPKALYLRPNETQESTDMLGVVFADKVFQPETNNELSLGAQLNQWKEIRGTAIYQNNKQVANADDLSSVTNATLSSDNKTLTITKRDGTSFNFQSGGVPKATCSTSSNTAAKVVNLDGFVVEKGAMIDVTFTYSNGSGFPKLNVNSTGAKSIQYYTIGVNGNSTLLTLAGGGDTSIPFGGWRAGDTIRFFYDGTYWIEVMNISTGTQYAIPYKASRADSATSASTSTTRDITDNSTNIATTAFVKSVLPNVTDVTLSSDSKTLTVTKLDGTSFDFQGGGSGKIALVTSPLGSEVIQDTETSQQINVMTRDTGQKITGSKYFTGTVGNIQTEAGIYLGLDANDAQPNANIAITSANTAAYIDMGRPDVDYDFRIIKWNTADNKHAQFVYGGNAAGAITIPQASGTMALTSDVETRLALNGSNTMTGKLNLKASGNDEGNIGPNGIRWNLDSLPQSTAPEYVCVIDGFAIGGRQKWTTVLDLKTQMFLPWRMETYANGDLVFSC